MERKPRLLFVTEAFGGGVFEYCLLLCNELASHFEVYLAYGVRPQTPEGFREMFDPRIHLIPVEHFVRSIRLGDDIRAGRELVRIYREVKPDLVHLHSSKAGAIGRIAFAFRKTPLFYTPHGYSFLMTNAGKLRRQVYFAMEYALARIPCTTVCCSAGEYRQALRLTRRARQINNAVNLRDIDAFLRENPPARHPFTVCTVGRICQQKNPALANRIARRMPDVRFVWVGDGELRSQLTAPNLEVTGWVKREQALRTLEQADVLLLPSLWEGLPLTLLEAMYCEVLCVVSDVVGNHDVIHSGVNGFVCPAEEDYVQAIRLAKDHPDQVQAMKERARQEVEQEYNASVMEQRYRAMYREALAGKG